MNHEAWINFIRIYLPRINTISNIGTLVLGGLTLISQQAENVDTTLILRSLFESISVIPFFLVPLEASVVAMARLRGIDYIDTGFAPMTNGRFENIAMFSVNLLLAFKLGTRV